MIIFGLSVSLTAIVAIVSSLGVIGALVFNGLTIRKDQKSRHYQAFMDLQNERDAIQKEFPDIRAFLPLTEPELKTIQKTYKLRSECTDGNTSNFMTRLLI